MLRECQRFLDTHNDMDLSHKDDAGQQKSGLKTAGVSLFTGSSQQTAAACQGLVRSSVGGKWMEDTGMVLWVQCLFLDLSGGGPLELCICDLVI